jgi:hypothetical protein
MELVHAWVALQCTAAKLRFGLAPILAVQKKTGGFSEQEGVAKNQKGAG